MPLTQLDSVLGQGSQRLQTLKGGLVLALICAIPAAPVLIVPSVFLARVSPFLPVVYIGALLIAGAGFWLWRRHRRRQRAARRNVALWAVNNGWEYAGATGTLLDQFPGEPLHRGVRRDVQHLVRGSISGHPSLGIVSRWYAKPDGAATGTVVAFVVELPAAVPQLRIHPGVGPDRVGALQLESEEFNRRFHVVAEEAKFGSDVLNPPMMQWLLDHDSGVSIRFDGVMLVVWRDGALDDVAELRRIVDFVTGILAHTPEFVFTEKWQLRPGHPAVPVSRVASGAYAPVGVALLGGKATHRGYHCRQFEQVVDLGNGKQEYRVVVDVDTAVQWPTLTIGRTGLVWSKGIVDLPDRLTTGKAEFDAQFSVAPSNNRALADSLVTADFAHYLLADPRCQNVFIQLYTRVLRPGREDVSAVSRAGVLSVAAAGRISDHALAARLTDLACDLIGQVPPPVWAGWKPSGPA